MPDGLVVRAMTAHDIDVVAALHVASWRSVYRSLLSDVYLDGQAPAERRAHWAKRLLSPRDRQVGLVAERDGVPLGFAFLYGEDDERWGTLLDNLHVDPDARGGGIGRALLAHAAAAIEARGWRRGLHLWVFAANAGARRFYERLGARIVDAAPIEAPDGTAPPGVCYAWAEMATLSGASTGPR